ncbi:hypothetical protein ACRB68_63790 [Actinomadura sp. RB68]|uniref:Uncharacterized protein n=1 Tax=Actinomadura macrotermitis TaxID=2585200 RepID=A0A7K0C569_9ACTN|nr:hypothetical protein [Actinomadura macrotermitis]
MVIGASELLVVFLVVLLIAAKIGFVVFMLRRSRR